MSDELLRLDTHLYEQLDMTALRRALSLQLPLVESVGTLRSSLLGMHLYLFALHQNCHALDRILILLKEYRSPWPASLEQELTCSAELRAQGSNRDDWLAVYRTEAQHLLVLAARSSAQTSELARRLHSYQIYACAHLLGQPSRPSFFERSEIEELLDPKTGEPAVLFARQFCERQRKPELIARELASYYQPFV